MISSMMLLLALQTPAWAVAVPPDSAAALERAASDAERKYERVLRQLAPEARDWPSSGSCDENVGRFCLRFGDPDRPPRPLGPEPPAARAARRSAVQALRRAFTVSPASWHFAGSLVRFLVEDERAGEAVAAARTFAMATPDSVLGPMLLGFALHYAGDVEAEEHLRLGLAALPPERRREVEEVEDLLTREERRLYRSLPERERAVYREEFWRAADPLYLLEGNERWREHIARWVWSRLLEDAPRVPGSHRWRGDLEELTIRYGVPVRRERIRRQSLHQMPLSNSMVERYDPDQLNLTPEGLRTEGLPHAVLPGEPEPIERRHAKSRHTPVETRGLRPLHHQVSRFPSGELVAVRVDGVLPLDSIVLDAAASATALRARAGLFLTDERHRQVTAADSRKSAAGDSIRFGLEVLAPPGTYHYSLEIVEPQTRLAGRARHPVRLDGSTGEGPLLSDIVIAEPYGQGWLPDRRDHAALRPLPALAIRAGQTVGLYAEAHRLDADAAGTSRYHVELSVHGAEGESLPGRAVRWLGRQLGFGAEPSRPRIAWQAESDAGGPAPIALDVDLGALDPGVYEVRLKVRDLLGGHEARMTRVLRVDALDR